MVTTGTASYPLSGFASAHLIPNRNPLSAGTTGAIRERAESPDVV